MLVAAALLGGAGAGQGQSSTSRVAYYRDRVGNMTGAQVQINVGGRVWSFTLNRAFLTLPLNTQLNWLDNRFNLGDDRKAVGQVLNTIRQARDREAQDRIQQRMQQQLQQMQQQQQLRQQIDQQRQQMQQQIQQPRPPQPIFQPPPPPPPVRVP
jgi:hypothetical protein